MTENLEVRAEAYRKIALDLEAQAAHEPLPNRKAKLLVASTRWRYLADLGAVRDGPAIFDV